MIRTARVVSVAAAVLLVAAFVAMAVPGGGRAVAEETWTQTQVAPGAQYDGVQVALDTSGDAVAQWDVDGPTADTIYGSRRPAGGDWSEPVALHTDLSLGARGMALDESGTALFIGLHRGMKLGAWRPDGAGDTVDTIFAADNFLEISHDAGDGDIVLTSYAEGPSQRTVYRERRAGTPVGEWYSAIALRGQYPLVAFSGTDDYVVARAGSLGIRAVMVDASAETVAAHRTWSAGCPRPHHLAAAFDRQGRGALAWRCGGDQPTIRAVYLRPGSDGRPTVLGSASRQGRVPLVGPTVAAGPHGVTVLWGRQGRTTASVRARSHGPRAAWSAPRVLAGGQQATGGLATSSAASGAALVTWSDDGTVRALVRRPGEPFGTPSPVTTVTHKVVATPEITRDGTVATVTLDYRVAPDPLSVFVDEQVP